MLYRGTPSCARANNMKSRSGGIRNAMLRNHLNNSNLRSMFWLQSQMISLRKNCLAPHLLQKLKVFQNMSIFLFIARTLNLIQFISCLLRFSDRIDRMKNRHTEISSSNHDLRNDFLTRKESVSSTQKSAVKISSYCYRFFNIHSQKFVENLTKNRNSRKIQTLAKPDVSLLKQIPQTEGKAKKKRKTKTLKKANVP